VGQFGVKYGNQVARDLTSIAEGRCSFNEHVGPFLADTTYCFTEAELIRDTETCPNNVGKAHLTVLASWRTRAPTPQAAPYSSDFTCREVSSFWYFFESLETLNETDEYALWQPLQTFQSEKNIKSLQPGTGADLTSYSRTVATGLFTSASSTYDFLYV
jgi:hypothetical protein